MNDIIEVLQMVADLEYFTRHPHRKANGDELSYAPIIVWRYKLPTTDIADFFERTVHDFRGTIAWEFTVTTRNWLLKPARIREYEESHGILGEWAAAEELQASDPDFGVRANAELRLLAEHIQLNLGKTGVRPVSPTIKDKSPDPIFPLRTA